MTSPTTSQANPDEADRQRHASYLTSLFGVLAGAVVFLPSILGIIKPPFVWEPLLYIFWVAGIVSLVLLAFAIYFLRFATTCAYPHRLSGAGSWLALLALACLVIYVAANGFQDRVSTPHIQSVTINPISPQAGDIVEVSADVTDEDQDRLRYGWTVDGKELAQGQIVYWAVPKAGSYNLQLRVDDGSSKRSQTKSLNVVVSEDKQSMSKESDLINASIMIGLKRVREKDPSKFADAVQGLPRSMATLQEVTDSAPNPALARGRPASPSAGEARPRCCDTMSLLDSGVVPPRSLGGTTRTTG